MPGGGGAPVRMAGEEYFIEGDVLVEHWNPWGEPIRTVGNLQRADRINANQWVQESWRSGLGYFKTIGVPPQDPNQPDAHPSFTGFNDSTIETRWEGQGSLPGLINSGAVTETAHYYTRFFKTSDNLIWLRAKEAGVSLGKWNRATHVVDNGESLTGDTWIPGATVDHNGSTFLLGGVAQTNAIMTYKPTTWSDVNPGTNPGGQFISAISFKDILYALYHDSTNKLLIVQKSTDDGAIWTTVAGIEVTEGPGNRAIYGHLVEYLDANGQPAPYLITDEAIWFLDINNSDLTKAYIFPSNLRDFATLPPKGIPRTFDPGDGIGNRLYIPRDGSMVEYHYSGFAQDISPFVAGNVPSKFLGPQAGFSAIFATENWLFAAWNNGTSGWVWAYDGEGWHYIWSKIAGITFGTDGDGIQDIIIDSSDANSGDVLLVLYTEDSDDVDIEYIDEVLINPMSSTTFKYALNGLIVTPHFDGGMSEEDGAILQHGLSAEGLDTLANNNEDIQFETEVDYAGSFGTGFKTFTAFSDSPSDGKHRYVDTVSSPTVLGFEARTWRHRYTLTRGSTNTKSPILYSVVTAYVKTVVDLHKYTFFIDLAKSAFANEFKFSRSAHKVWDVLADLNDQKTMFEFRMVGTDIHGSGNPRYVKMEEFPVLVDVDGNPASHTQKALSGNARIVLVESL